MENLKALILDDEEELTFLLSTVLEFNNFEVTPTNRGEDALEELKKNSFDIFITDYKMDGMDGMETIKTVRDELKVNGMKIILLTFKDLDVSEMDKLSNYNVVYLKKPFLPNELVLKIQNLFA